MSRYRKHLNEILTLMEDQSKIRNVGIVAHIDHGKTTLSDSLLSASGYLSDELAGSVRALDYLEEEQLRGITIKAANISLLFNYNADSYLVNLVDTPGHVDFTGNVTRALRVIDGVIIVVDSVEGVMAQTETVTRQALSENIKPVLFINKIDRLINELKLSESEIQARLQNIIIEFNSLIESYSEDRFKSNWKINPINGSAFFGSALDRWGFNYEIFSKRNLKFKFIIEKYKNNEKSLLKSALPIHEPVIQAIINHLPSPREAQKYRIDKIWSGSLESEAGDYLTRCESSGPVILAVSSVLYDPKLKYTLIARIFSGTIRRGQVLVSLSDKSTHTVNQLFLIMGPSREPIDKATAGNIIGITSNVNIKSGETLVQEGFDNKMIPFEQIRYVSEPVMTVSLEPVKLTQLPELIEALELLVIQDPNLKISINKETGEYLLSGIGELHLEITIKKLREKGFDIIASEPMVIYRETIKNQMELTVEPTSQFIKKLGLKLAPLDEDIISFLARYSNEISDQKKIFNILKRSFKDNPFIEKIMCVFPNENILVSDVPEINPKISEILIQVFKSKLAAGLLCEEPVRGMLIYIKELDLDEKKLNIVELTSILNDLFNQIYNSCSPLLLEPIYRIQVTSHPEFVGKISTLISQRRGRVETIIEGRNTVTINGFIPVRETFKLSDELRSKTSGRAFWQMQFHNWQPLGKKEEEQVVRELRERKGLPV
ncbi:MAG: GTP-binding protein [Candidatus Odinarchaeum yellowstonii]|uniref:Elongation factor 2 n=1 Tax=Odinarchaeota yellowstonii (strain LCB_4) TaxID=1841599 RepID=A0AAF0D3K5_ODILC|nr:MAG: GTP-binding protein [Candidatus Odinarchaeum yellowstonii]